MLMDFDYIDLGRIRLPSNTVPVTIKSLVFSEDPRGPRRASGCIIMPMTSMGATGMIITIITMATTHPHDHHDHGHAHPHDHDHTSAHSASAKAGSRSGVDVDLG